MVVRPAVASNAAALDLPWTADLPEASRRMVDAAVDAFADRGFHATTTRDIATRSGLSPAALYVHFPSKGALLARISRLGHEAVLRLVQQTLQEHVDPVEALRAVISDFATWHARHHRVARVVQYELAALPDADLRAVMAVRQAIERAVEGLLHDGVQRGLMAADDEHSVARAILSLCVDVARWFDPSGSQTPEDVGGLYAQLALRMVRP